MVKDETMGSYSMLVALTIVNIAYVLMTMQSGLSQPADHLRPVIPRRPLIPRANSACLYQFRVAMLECTGHPLLNPRRGASSNSFLVPIGMKQAAHGHGHHHKHHSSSHNGDDDNGDDNNHGDEEEPPQISHSQYKDCCEWIGHMDSGCVCQLVAHLPPFLAGFGHTYSKILDACEVSYECEPVH